MASDFCLRSARKRVVVTDYNFRDVERERFAAESAGAEFAAHQCRTSEDIRAAVAGANVVVVQFAQIDSDTLGSLAPGARVVRYGVGYNNIDVKAARGLGQDVAYVPDYCTDEVADHTAALCLCLVRQINQLDGEVRKGSWNVLSTAPGIRAPKSLTLGFLGLGRIGRGTLARLAPFGFSPVVHDPALSLQDAEVLGVCAVDLDRLFAISDILILHAPLTEGTRHIVNAKRLRAMPPGAFIVNTSRGGLIDETALKISLDSGHTAGAALDVFEEEPLSASSPLMQARGLLITPHAAWYSDTALGKLQALAAEEVSRGLRGDAPRCRVPD